MCLCGALITSSTLLLAQRRRAASDVHSSMMDCRSIAIDISLIYAHAINLIEFFPSSSSFQEPANLAVCRARKKPQQHLTTGKTRRSIKSTSNNNAVIKRGALKFYMHHEWIWEELSINRSDRQ